MVCGERQAVEAGCLPESALEGEHGRQQALVVVDPLSSGAVLAQVSWIGRESGGGGFEVAVWPKPSQAQASDGPTDGTNQ